MRGVAGLLVGRNVAEGEAIQTSEGSGVRANAGGWKEDSPRNQPDGNKNPDHHAQEAHKEVRIHSRLGPNFMVVCIEHGPWP